MTQLKTKAISKRTPIPEKKRARRREPVTSAGTGALIPFVAINKHPPLRFGLTPTRGVTTYLAYLAGASQYPL